MRNFILFIMASMSLLALNACSGLGQAKPASAAYDFGLNAPMTDVPSTVVVEELVSLDALNSNRIRYRLVYESDSRVYSYAESRWVAPPVQLLEQRLKTMAGTPTMLGCSLRLQLTVFDHVFASLENSSGVAQLSAVLIDKKTRNVIAKQQLQSQVKAEVAEAKGGVVALQKAGDEVLKQAIEWSNAQAAATANCR